MAKAKLEVELVDHVTGKASKAARAAEALLKSERRQQEKLAKSQERAHAKLQAEQRRTQERQAKASEQERVRGERSYMQAVKLARKEKEQKAKAQAVIAAKQHRATEQAIKLANREHDKREKLRRQDIINHARGVAKKDRLDQRAAARRHAAFEKSQAKSDAGFAMAGEGVRGMAGGLLLGGAAAVTALGAAAISTSHDFATMGEKTRFAMEAVSGGKWKVDDLLAQSDELALKFGMDLFATRQQFRDLLDLDLNPEQIDHFVKLGASMLAAGESAESADLMIKALTKVKTKGVLDTKGLMALGAAGVQRTHLLKALGDELGIANADEEDLAEALGKKGMAADKALPLIERALTEGVGEEKAGDFATRFATESVAGREAVVKTKAQKIALIAAEKNHGGFADAVTAAEGAVNSDKAQAFADKGASWVSEFMTGASKVFTDFVQEGFVSQGDSTIDKWLDDFFHIDNPQAIIDATFKSGQAVDSGLAQGINDGTKSVAAAAALADRVTGTIDERLQIHSPSRVLRGRGRFTAEGFSLGLEDGVRGVEASAGVMADAVVPAVNSAASPGTSKLAGAGGAGRAPISIGPFTFNGISNSEELAPLVERAVRRGVESMLREEAAKVG